MVNLISANINLTTCKSDLQNFKILLDSHKEIDETILLKFFKDRPNLILLLGKLVLGSASYYKDEFNIFNEFYADFAICNTEKNMYVFVEFEEAKKNSIFKQVGKTRGITRFEWSDKFEHGYSQVIDWFFRLDDFAETNKFQEHFGVNEISYTGYLVIGRQKISIPNFGYQDRLDWRTKKVIVNGKSIICMTYDELYFEMQKKIEEFEYLI